MRHAHADEASQCIETVRISGRGNECCMHRRASGSTAARQNASARRQKGSAAQTGSGGEKASSAEKDGFGATPALAIAAPAADAP
jgi:hypothetical protein